MKLIFNYMIRAVSKSKLKATIVILSFAFMAALLLVNIMTLNAGEKIYTESSQEKYGCADVVCKPFGENLLFINKDDISSLNGNDLRSQVDMANFIVSFENNDRKRRIMVYSGNLDELRKTELFDDNENKTNDDVLYVSKDFLKKYGYSDGEEIEIGYSEKTCNVKLVSANDKKGILSQSYFFDLAVADEGLFEKVSGMEFTPNMIYYDLEKGVSKTDFIDELNKNNPDYRFSSLLNDASMKKDISTLNTVLLIVMILIAVMSTVVICALYNHIIESHITAVGTFRSIGIKKSRINLILSSETVLYGLLGGIIGAGLGVFFFRYMIKEMIGSDSYVKSTPVSYILITILFPVVWSLILTFFMLRKVYKKPIVNIIKKYSSDFKRFKYKKYIAAAVILIIGFVMSFVKNRMVCIAAYLIMAVCFTYIVPLLIALVNKLLNRIFGIGNKISYILSSVVSNKLIMRSIIVSIVSMSLIIPVFAAKKSINDVFRFAELNYEYDAVIGLNGNTEIDIEEIDELSSVDKSYSMYFLSTGANLYMEAEGTDGKIPVCYLGREENDEFDDWLHDSVDVEASLLRELKESENNVIIDKSLAKKYSINKGDTVVCHSNQYSGEYKVIGFCDSYKFDSNTNTVIMDLEQYKKNINSAPQSTYLRTKTTVDEMIKQVDEKFIDYSIVIKSKKEFIDKQIEGSNMLLQLITVVIYFSLIICFIGIINNLVTDFLNRKKEFAVLISTSMSHKQLSLITVVQMLFVALYSIIGSVILSCIITKLIDNIVVHFDLLKNGLIYPASDAIGIFIISLIVFIAVIIVPVYIIKKIDIYYYLRRE